MGFVFHINEQYLSITGNTEFWIATVKEKSRLFMIYRDTVC